MNNHVTSLELSQKLKALGVPQKSEFYWMKPTSPMDHGDSTLYQENGYFLGKLSDIGSAWCEEYFSAFLASEIGELLPSDCDTHNNLFDSGNVTPWTVQYLRNGTKFYQHGKTMPESMGLMLAYLKERKII